MHLDKNKGRISNPTRYQEMPITRMTRNKRCSDYYTSNRKRKTIVQKSIVNEFGYRRVVDISDKDYDRGEQIVNRLSNDWMKNRKVFENNLLDPFDN